MNNSKSISPCFDSSKHDAHIECYKGFMMSSNIAKRKSEGEGTSTLNNIRRVRGPGEDEKQLYPGFPSGAIKIKYKKLISCLFNLQTLADPIFRSINIKEDGT